MGAGAGAGPGVAVDVAGTFQVADDGGDGLERITTAFAPSFGFAPAAGQTNVTSPAIARIGTAEGSGVVAQRLFNAMTRAVEDVTERGVERTSPGGDLSCRQFRTQYECEIVHVRGVEPPDGSDLSSLVSTELSVIDDIADAIDPSLSADGVNIPGALSATVGKGIFRLAIAGNVGVVAPEEDSPPARFHFSTSFGGLAKGARMPPEMATAKAVYDAMTEAKETYEASTDTTTRATRGGRVVCSTHSLEFTGAWYGCSVNGVRFIDP
jgi:hypothetical protein